LATATLLLLEKGLLTPAFDIPKTGFSAPKIGRKGGAQVQIRGRCCFTNQTGFFSASSIDGQGNYGYYPAPRTDRRKRPFYA
jgi:hypothetical protein